MIPNLSLYAAECTVLLYLITLLALLILLRYVANRYCETLSRQGVPSNADMRWANSAYYYSTLGTISIALSLTLILAFCVWAESILMLLGR